MLKKPNYFKTENCVGVGVEKERERSLVVLCLVLGNTVYFVEYHSGICFWNQLTHMLLEKAFGSRNNNRLTKFLRLEVIIVTSSSRSEVNWRRRGKKQVKSFFYSHSVWWWDFSWNYVHMKKQKSTCICINYTIIRIIYFTLAGNDSIYSRFMWVIVQEGSSRFQGAKGNDKEFAFNACMLIWRTFTNSICN